MTKTDLWSISNAAEERARANGRAFRNYDDGFCTACGRKLGANPLTVQVHVSGQVILPSDPLFNDVNSPVFQGTWEIGPECAKKVMTPAQIAEVRAELDAAAA